MTAPRSTPFDDAPAAADAASIAVNSRGVHAADAGSPPPPAIVSEPSAPADSIEGTPPAPFADGREGTAASSADRLGVRIEGPDPLVDRVARVSRASSEIPPVALPASQEESPSLAAANDFELAFEDPAFAGGGEWDAMFFAGGSAPQVEEAYEEPDAWLERRALIAASAGRRAYFARYVLGAVAFSSALCIVALAKAAIFGGGPWGGESASAAMAATTVAPSRVGGAGAETGAPRVGGQALTEPQTPSSEAPAAPAAATAGVDPRPSPVGEPASALAAEEPRAAAPADREAASAAAPPASTPSAAAPSAAPASVAPPPAATPPVAPSAATPGDLGAAERAREAARQREVSRAALDRNRVADAIAAGERAVSLDATDGEAWLILGAAYQQRGDMTSARRCYRACASQGKRGPRSECAQMLR